MEVLSTIPDFTKHYVALAHGLRLVSGGDSFILGPNYRMVTLHVPGRKIKDSLTKIILDQIHSKMSLIDNLFIIGCPIARQSVRENLEKSFIVDWLLKKHKEPISIDNLTKDLASIGDPNAYSTKITTRTQLVEYIETLNFSQIKSSLEFEIRTYRPNELAPKMVLEFKLNDSNHIAPSGIFDKTANLISPSSIKSLVNFNDKNSYLFDKSDIECPNDKSFFDKIKPIINTGLIVILSCDCYKGEPTRELKTCSTKSQKLSYNKKYEINYE